MSSDFERKLRKLSSPTRNQALRPRADSELAFLGANNPRPRSFLYDTTVYVDILQGRFPGNGDLFLRAADAWHSTVAESELAVLCGLLDPQNPQTRNVIEQVSYVLDHIPAHRTLTPDAGVWQNAGLLAGAISRLQGFSKPDRRRLLNDALIFVTARKHGHTVLTRNRVDFDFLQQLDPSGRVLFYLV